MLRKITARNLWVLVIVWTLTLCPISILVSISVDLYEQGSLDMLDLILFPWWPVNSQVLILRVDRVVSFKSLWTGLSLSTGGVLWSRSNSAFKSSSKMCKKQCLRILNTASGTFFPGKIQFIGYGRKFAVILNWKAKITFWRKENGNLMF